MVNDLAFDRRFNVVDKPTDWAFTWDCAEGGTSQPIPRDHHATLFLTMNADGDASTALRNFFKVFGKKHPIKLTVKALAEEDDLMHKLKVRSREGCKSAMTMIGIRMLGITSTIDKIVDITAKTKFKKDSLERYVIIVDYLPCRYKTIRKHTIVA